jgi:hypothetical protein
MLLLMLSVLSPSVQTHPFFCPSQHPFPVNFSKKLNLFHHQLFSLTIIGPLIAFNYFHFKRIFHLLPVPALPNIWTISKAPYPAPAPAPTLLPPLISINIFGAPILHFRSGSFIRLSARKFT